MKSLNKDLCIIRRSPAEKALIEPVPLKYNVTTFGGQRKWEKDWLEISHIDGLNYGAIRKWPGSFNSNLNHKTLE